MYVHADLEEDQRDASVLTNRAVTLGAHPRIDQNLGDSVLGRWAFLALVGLRQRLDVIDRVVVTDVLEGVGDALNEIFLTDGGHGISHSRGIRRGAAPGTGYGDGYFTAFPQVGRCCPSYRSFDATILLNFGFTPTQRFAVTLTPFDHAGGTPAATFQEPLEHG